MIDIVTYNSAKAVLTASIREQHGPRVGPTNVRKLDPSTEISQTPEERAAVVRQRAEMDKHATQTRASVIKQTGRDPLVPDKIDRTPWTEEQQAAYVQERLDRLVASDAKIQQLRQMEQQWLSRSLTKTAQGSLVDTSA